jgi:hypothetical protein
VKQTILFIALILLATPSLSLAQTLNPSVSGNSKVAPAIKDAKLAKKTHTTPKPLSRIALGGGVSPLGVNLQAATNLNQRLNLRASGNVFNYNVNNISTNGFNVDAKLNFATAGASLDFYPFPSHGFRLSPGVLFYNTNAASANFTVQNGTSFSLDNYTYYSSTTNPVHGVGTFGLHTQKPAFTMTTGWGNVIPHKGGHLSFPFELGVAFIGSPAINVTLDSGQVCDGQGQNCIDVATDKDVQTNLQAQIAKYKNDLDPLKTFPIVSFGVAYNFRIR